MNESIKNPLEQPEFVQRLNQVVAPYRESKRVSWLANEIGRTESTLRSWLKGDSLPNVMDISNICEKTGTHVAWLITGHGPKTLAEIAEYRATYAGGAGQVFARDLVTAVVRAMEEEIESAGINFSPSKRADLVAAFCLLFRTPDKIDREAIRIMLRAAA